VKKKALPFILLIATMLLTIILSLVAGQSIGTKTILLSLLFGFLVFEISYYMTHKRYLQQDRPLGTDSSSHPVQGLTISAIVVTIIGLIVLTTLF
jgi:sterol desaturase/sphingolipid hydroxylase (fatty acid hydroxylase superfamily)